MASSYLTVRVLPGGKRDEVVNCDDSALRVRVRARPEKGRANQAVCALVASTLGLPTGAVMVLRGNTARNKVLLVDGMDAAEVRQRLRDR